MTEEKKMRKLNIREKKFCKLYVSRPVATQAYIDAGYSPNGAGQSAFVLLKRPEIQAYIKELESELLASIGITKEKIFNEMLRIATVDMRRAYNENGELLPIHEIPDDVAAVIEQIEVYEEFVGKGDAREKIGETKKIKPAKKMDAINAILRMAGWNAPEKIAHTNAAGDDVVFLPKKELHDETE